MSNQRSLRHRITGALVLSLGAAAFAPAQCGFDWQPGSSWPGPNGAVMALVNAANGDLIAGGWFEVADAAVVHHVARWNGSNWDAVGAGFDGDVNALAVLANGDFVAGGAFTLTGGLPANRIARWNGSTWSPLGAGLDGVVRELPWTGGTFRAAATGLPPLALAVHAVGTPLPATPLPLATSNCWWFVAPILLDLVAPAGSTAVATFAVPRTASLVGQLVHTQLVVVERDATLALQRLTSSNALQLTIGGF